MFGFDVYVDSIKQKKSRFESRDNFIARMIYCTDLSGGFQVGAEYYFSEQKIHMEILLLQ